MLDKPHKSGQIWCGSNASSRQSSLISFTDKGDSTRLQAPLGLCQHPCSISDSWSRDSCPNHSLRQGFSASALLTLGTRQFSVVGAVLCIVGCLAASLGQKRPSMKDHWSRPLRAGVGPHTSAIPSALPPVPSPDPVGEWMPYSTSVCLSLQKVLERGESSGSRIRESRALGRADAARVLLDIPSSPCVGGAPPAAGWCHS